MKDLKALLEQIVKVQSNIIEDCAEREDFESNEIIRSILAEISEEQLREALINELDHKIDTILSFFQILEEYVDELVMLRNELVDDDEAEDEDNDSCECGCCDCSGYYDHHDHECTCHDESKHDCLAEEEFKAKNENYVKSVRGLIDSMFEDNFFKFNESEIRNFINGVK